MGDVFAGIAAAPIWSIILLAATLYLLIVGGLRIFLRPAMAGNLDPLNIKLLFFIGPAIIGFILSPFLIHSGFSGSYFAILLFMGFWVLIIRVCGRPRVIDLRDRMDLNFQGALLALTVLIILANVAVNMIIPGKIPLLMEGGGLNSRFEATENSRLLTWLSFATAPMAGLIYAVTHDRRIRKLALVAVAFQVVESLLFASKGAILTIVFILLNTLFMASARGECERYKNIRRNLIIAILVVALLAPFYLVIIGAGSGAAAGGLLAVRFLGGFDQLIFASQLDLLPDKGFQPVLKTNLFEYQLMPFFKVFSSKQYDYSNVGQYIIEVVTGGSIDSYGTYPNSNLILEATFTSGRYLGALFFVLELAGFYWCRRLVLKRPITPLSLVLVQAVVLDPFSLFSSGQDFVTQTILAFLAVVAALVVAKFWALFGLVVGHAPARMQSAA